MTTVLDILGTSTPVSEIVAQELGLVRAAIVCRVFFYQQLKDGVCKASVASFAKSLGLSVGAVSGNLTWLLENDWIENTKPLVKGKRPNHYKVTQNFLNLVSPSEEQRSANECNVQQVNVNVQQVKEKEDIKEESKEELLPKGSASAPAAEDKIKKPKTAIKEQFLELTNLKMPTRKKDAGWWWSGFGEIYCIFDKDATRAIKGEQEVIQYMMANNLTIAGPQSLLKLCRAVASGQSLANGRNENGYKRNGNGRTKRPHASSEIPELAKGLGEWTAEERAQFGG